MTAANIGRALWAFDVRPFALAASLASRGFRTPRVRGWSYDRNGTTSTTLIVLAIFTVPQALVFDVLFSHSSIARIISALVHAYAVTWSLALASTVRTEPHIIADGRATLHLPLLQSVEFALADVESVQFAARRPRGVPRFGLGKSGIVVHLRVAARVDRAMLARLTSDVFVAADELNALANALTRSDTSFPDARR